MKYQIYFLDRIFRGQIVQPAGRAGYTTSEIPINNRMGNVDGGYPHQNSMLIQNGQGNDAMLFTFDRNNEDGLPISTQYEGVNVGGTVYSPSTALGGDPSRSGFWIEPGIVQYNYRNAKDTDQWIGKPNFVLRSTIDTYDYQNPIGQQYPELVKILHILISKIR